MHRLRTLRQMCALMTGGLIAGILLCEVLLRTLIFSHLLPQSLQQYFHRMDEELTLKEKTLRRSPRDFLWVLKPGVTSVTSLPDEKGRRLYKVKTIPIPGTNIGVFDDGLNGTAPFAVCSGDSFTFGNGVKLEENWVERLEKMTGKDFFNLSVPGFSSASALRMLLKHGLPMKPRIALYSFFINDIDDTMNSFTHPPFASGLRLWLNAHTKMYLLLKFPREKNEASAKKSQRARAPDNKPRQVFTTYYLKMGSLSSRHYSEAWAMTQKLLKEVQSESNRAGVRFIVVGVPVKEDVYWKIARASLGLHPSAQHPHYWLTVMEKFCRQNGIEFFDLTPALRVYAEKGEKLYFTYDGHWNERGNKIVAEAFHHYLTKQDTGSKGNE